MTKEIRALSDEALLSRTDCLVKEETKLTLEIVHHLKEVNRRMLYAQLGYPSLFEYCTSRLGYSGACASRRIDLMHAIAEMPFIEEKIEEGALTISVVS